MSGPGKSHRPGLTVVQLMDMFPNEAAAREWFETARWGSHRVCPHCGHDDTRPCKNDKPMPYRCARCRKHFSVMTGTVMQASKLPLRKWAIGIYLMSTSLKGVSSMKLHRDLGVTQKTAWMMAQKIRQGWLDGTAGPLSGTVEFDETYIGGKRKNMPARKRKQLEGRGMTETPKRGRGRPVEKPIEPLSATAEEIRDAIFRAADKPKGGAGEQPA